MGSNLKSNEIVIIAGVLIGALAAALHYVYTERNREQLYFNDMSLPRRTRPKNATDSPFCNLCLKYFKVSEAKSRTRCNHCFHFRCIQIWKSSNPNMLCPKCPMRADK